MNQGNRNLKVLVADDDEGVRMFLKMVISAWGYHVIEAHDGQEAWRAMDFLAVPDIALLDWDMPEIDGIQLCRQVRAKKKEQTYIYLIVITGKGAAQDVVEALNAGADDYLQKPLDTNQLKSRLEVGARVAGYERGLREENRQLSTRMDELTWKMQWLLKLNQTLLTLTPDYAYNVAHLLGACCPMLNHASVIYYVSHSDVLHPVGHWNVPDNDPRDIPLAGSLCARAVRSGGKGNADVVVDVGDSGFRGSDPRVNAYAIQAHVALPVFSQGVRVGCLSTFYSRSNSVEKDDLQTLQFLATALGVEEDRHRAAASGAGR
ncbi:MAG: response regulator [Kiritimatiellae bacterium]|nr:response regulator [Kiritimatiellia bacterium]